MSSKSSPPTVMDRDKPLAWFRFEADFVTDPTIAQLSESAQLYYVKALCATARRIAPCSDEQFAWWTRARPSRVLAAKKELLAACLITDEWCVENWEQRNPPIDRTAAERQRRRRRLAAETSRVEAVEPSHGTRDDPRNVEVPAEIEGSHAVTSRPVTALQGQGSGQEQLHLHKKLLLAFSEDAATPGKNGIDMQAILPGSPEGISRGSAKGRCADFETINAHVLALLTAGGFSPNDPSAIAKVANYSRPQVTEALRQLRDRGQL